MKLVFSLKNNVVQRTVLKLELPAVNSKLGTQTELTKKEAFECAHRWIFVFH